MRKRHCKCKKNLPNCCYCALTPTSQENPSVLEKALVSDSLQFKFKKARQGLVKTMPTSIMTARNMPDLDLSCAGPSTAEPTTSKGGKSHNLLEFTCSGCTECNVGIANVGASPKINIISNVVVKAKNTTVSAEPAKAGAAETTQSSPRSKLFKRQCDMMLNKIHLRQYVPNSDSEDEFQNKVPSKKTPRVSRIGNKRKSATATTVTSLAKKGKKAIRPSNKDLKNTIALPLKDAESGSSISQRQGTEEVLDQVVSLEEALVERNKTNAVAGERTDADARKTFFIESSGVFGRSADNTSQVGDSSKSLDQPLEILNQATDVLAQMPSPLPDDFSICSYNIFENSQNSENSSTVTKVIGAIIERLGDMTDEVPGPSHLNIPVNDDRGNENGHINSGAPLIPACDVSSIQSAEPAVPPATQAEYSWAEGGEEWEDAANAHTDKVLADIAKAEREKKRRVLRNKINAHRKRFFYFSNAAILQQQKIIEAERELEALDSQ